MDVFSFCMVFTGSESYMYFSQRPNKGLDPVEKVRIRIDNPDCAHPKV